MRLTAILFLAMLTGFSCKKETGSGALDGKWKMIKYYDRNTNSFYTKPDTSRDVFLVIDGNKYIAFSGLKPMGDGTYLLNGNDITFNFGNMYFDIVTNDSWTDMFSWAIHACSLQSVFPCRPSSLETLFPNQIRINTPLRMDIILMKVQ
jgi:hypothetical protein